MIKRRKKNLNWKLHCFEGEKILCKKYKEMEKTLLIKKIWKNRRKTFRIWNKRKNCQISQKKCVRRKLTNEKFMKAKYKKIKIIIN